MNHKIFLISVIIKIPEISLFIENSPLKSPTIKDISIKKIELADKNNKLSPKKQQIKTKKAEESKKLYDLLEKVRKLMHK